MVEKLEEVQGQPGIASPPSPHFWPFRLHSKTLVLKVTPLVLIEEDHTKWVLNFNTKLITPNTSLVLFQHFNTLGVKITPVGVKI